MRTRLIPLDRISGKKKGKQRGIINTVAEDKRRNERDRAHDILMEAQAYWQNMHRFREERARNKRYTYGNQWDDIVCIDGKTMTEGDYIKQQGSVPLKNNLIRRLVKNVLGVYRSQDKEPTCTARDREEQSSGETMSILLQYNMQLNKMNELHARTMEEFLISGLAVQKKTFGWRNDKYDVWTDVVQPNNFFIDNCMKDFRGWDVSCVGEIHDLEFGELCAKFAKNREDFTRLAEIYRAARDKGSLVDYYTEFGYSRDKYYDFLMPHDNSRCRVIEVWRKESKTRYRCHDYLKGDWFKINAEDYNSMVAAVNASRIEQGVAAGMEVDNIPLIEAEWFVDSYWYYYFLSPFGDILQEDETPYAHKSHPYVFKTYPYIDGEIHSFVADVIDQQRYVNRLITLNDWITRASAKGALLVPEDSIPQGMSLEDFADEWSRFNGVILYTPSKHGHVPQQIATNSTNIGTTELLNLQLKFFEDISGVNGALQGKPGYSGMSGSLYAQQTQNATTSLLDMLETYSTFVVDGATKDVKNMQQCYDDKRIVKIAGNKLQAKYDPEQIRNIEFDLSVVESKSTPAYRQIANDFLMQIWSSGQITLEQLLENGEFPFADQLLQSIKVQQEQMQQGQVPQPIPQELQEQAQQGADLKAVTRAANMLQG